MKRKGRDYSVQESRVIDRFYGEWEIFSNFYPVIVTYKDYNFQTVEHAYQAAKSIDPFFLKELSELSADQAGVAKRLGRKTQLRKDWNMVKLSIMRRLLMQKFSYQLFREKLLSTGEATLVEGNYWHDNYWGDCFCKKCQSIDGQNRLGKMLMDVRRIIR